MNSIIIVAGGSGSRMKSDIPKQFIVVKGLPIIMHTINKFYMYDNTMQIILVLPQNEHDRWFNLCKKYNFNIPVDLTSGGKTRFDSVKNGLKLIKNSILVGVHDGVRPLVSIDTISSCYKSAKENDCGIPVVETLESLRRVTSKGNFAVARKEFRNVQTPQVFNAKLLYEAYNVKFSDFFTDDASVFENAGNKIYLTNGNYENIKITTPMDIKIAESLL